MAEHEPVRQRAPRQARDSAAIFAEKDRIARLGRIREVVFGSLDGLLVPLGVVSGVAGGTGSTHAVIVAGLAESFAGALAMGAGEFISGRSQAQVQRSEINKEMAEIRTSPDDELREMEQLWSHEGVGVQDAHALTTLLARYPRAYHKTMIEKELGLQMEMNLVRVAEALTIGISYIVGSIFPLIAYFFFPLHVALIVSLVLTIVALVIVGIIKGQLANLNLVRSCAEVVLVGGASALGGYVLGSIAPHLLGF